MKKKQQILIEFDCFQGDAVDLPAKSGETKAPSTLNLAEQHSGFKKREKQKKGAEAHVTLVFGAAAVVLFLLLLLLLMPYHPVCGFQMLYVC